MKFESSYIKLYESGALDERIRELYGILESCELCPRRCGKNRLKGERGFCRSGRELMVSSYGPHFGEEEPLVGTEGSGTIFLTNCNLRCVYCQNYEISHLGIGREVSTERAAEMMIELQRRGCHNINLVTPTHFTPQIARSIRYAIKRGLCLPIVYNCGGYENVETIKLLEGIVDIYMPDIKYSSKEPAKKYSDAPDYFDRCREAVEEMHRQVGDLKMDEDGIAYRGLLIRHLILPDGLAGSKEVLKFVSGLSKDSYVNIMDQYRPEGEAWDYKELSRRPTRKEFYDAMNMAKGYGLHRFSKESFRIYYRGF
ncbi:MAG: Radical SAM superfamily protein [Candidatus Methanolliviera sp. GoM_asphalt]|nr:MAG: Radical SAM superfamily protein [Candidatus Methanolliviera sp. GoM_asphalt]